MNHSDEIALLAKATEAAARGNFSPPLPESCSPAMAPLLSSFRGLLAALEKQAEEREAATKRRENAIAGIAHDLRAPLTTIRGYTEALQKGLARTPEKERAYLAAIALRARELSERIDTLSFVSRGAGHLPIRPLPTSFAAFLREYLEANRPLLESRAASVVADLDPSVILPLDRSAFSRVLDNLFSNTLKYRLVPHSSIVLSLRRSGENAVFTYQDNGPGIRPQEALEKIFLPWYRAPDQKKAGSGLGLYVVSQIAAAHGGTAAAENRDGLAITITLPITGGISC